MAEIGAGSGSGYPGEIDTNASLEYNNSVSNRTKARADVPNDLAAAIVAIETTLGINPHGTRATVVSYLQQEHTPTGAHNDAYVVTTSGNNQHITGTKLFDAGIGVSNSGRFDGGINVAASGFWGTYTGTYELGKVHLSGAVPWFSEGVRVSGRVVPGNAGYYDQHTTASLAAGAEESWTITHGLGTNNVIVSVLGYGSSTQQWSLHARRPDGQGLYFNGTTVNIASVPSAGNVAFTVRNNAVSAQAIAVSTMVMGYL